MIKDANSPSRWNMRIWDVDKGEWLGEHDEHGLPYYGFDIRGGEVTTVQGMRWVYQEWFHGKEMIWEQSTGCVDKNGKEIYEGDIIKVTTTTDKDDYEDSGIVIFYDSRFIISRYPQKDKQFHDDYWYLNDTVVFQFEVAGNIHENPELLDKTNQ